MKINVKFKLSENVYEVELDEKDEMDTLHKAIVLSNPKKKCICGNTNGLYMDSNKDKEGNTYVNIVCPECNAKSKLGRYKTGGFFWHDFKVWGERPEKKPVTSDDVDDDFLKDVK